MNKTEKRRKTISTSHINSAICQPEVDLKKGYQHSKHQLHELATAVNLPSSNSRALYLPADPKPIVC